MSSGTPIETWVTQAKSGDEAGFEALFDHFFPKVYRYIHFRVSPEEAEDLVADVFLKVVQHLPRYHSQKKGTFQAWIFRIAHNTVIDFYRKKKDLLGMEDEDSDSIFLRLPDENPTPDEDTNNLFNNQKIHQLLQKLPPLQQEILELKFLQGLTNTEISTVTGKSEGNVRVIQLRALREMRKRWGEGGD
jgi:RNA polymerase sigma-70 factor (ECF subfamily)